MNQYTDPVAPTPDDDPLLRSALDQQGARVRIGAGLADRAIARDRSQRRRRAGMAALGAGLVLAIAVPIAWSATRPTDIPPVPATPTQPTTQAPSTTATPSPTSTGGTPSTTPAPPPTSTASPTPTAVPTVTADGSPALSVLRPASGEPTATTNVPYVIDGVIHDGARTIRLEETGHEGPIARLEGGRWLVVGKQTITTLVVDADGATLAKLSGWAVAGDDGSLFVIADFNGDLRAYDSSGRLVDTLPVSTCQCGSGSDPGRYTTIGIIGSVVYANRGGKDAAVAWDVTSGTRRALKGRVELVNTARRTALMAAGVTRAGLCHELRDLVTGRTFWRICGPLSFRSFSSDGAYLLASGWIDGLGEAQRNPDGSYRYGTLVVVRASDAAIVLDSGGGGAAGTAVTYRMGDDETLTVQVGFPAGTRDLQRCTLTGECEVVAPGRPRLQADVPMGDDPYYLSVN
jgi:hypothetical protein